MAFAPRDGVAAGDALPDGLMLALVLAEVPVAAPVVVVAPVVVLVPVVVLPEMAPPAAAPPLTP